jgi:hypothetical protein
MLRRSTDRLHKKGASIQSEKCRIAPYQTVTVISTSVIMSVERRRGKRRSQGVVKNSTNIIACPR